MDRLIRFGRGEINRLDVVCASDVVVDCLGGILSSSSMLNRGGNDVIAYDYSKQLFPRRYVLGSQIGGRNDVAVCARKWLSDASIVNYHSLLFAGW